MSDTPQFDPTVPEATDAGDSSEAAVPEGTNLWPNEPEVVDGVTPTSEVSQDPNLFVDDDDAELDREMED